MLWPEEFVDTGQIVEDSHVVGHDDSQAVSFGKCLSKVFTVALDGERYRCRVEAIGTVADLAPATTSTEWENLPKGIEKQIQTALVQILFQDLGISEWEAARHPGLDAVRGCCTEFSEFLNEQFGDVCQCLGSSHGVPSDYSSTKHFTSAL